MIIPWTVDEGERINLGGEFFKVVSTEWHKGGVTLNLKPAKAKKPVSHKSAFKPVFPKSEWKHL